MAFYGYLWLFMVIYGNLRLSMAFYGYLWLFMLIYGILRLSMAFYGYLLLFIAFYGYLWSKFFFMAMYRYVWLFMTMYAGYLWLWLFTFFLWYVTNVFNCMLNHVWKGCEVAVRCLSYVVYFPDFPWQPVWRWKGTDGRDPDDKWRLDHIYSLINIQYHLISALSVWLN